MRFEMGEIPLEQLVLVRTARAFRNFGVTPHVENYPCRFHHLRTRGNPASGAKANDVLSLVRKFKTLDSDDSIPARVMQHRETVFSRIDPVRHLDRLSVTLQPNAIALI